MFLHSLTQFSSPISLCLISIISIVSFNPFTLSINYVINPYLALSFSFHLVIHSPYIAYHSFQSLYTITPSNPSLFIISQYTPYISYPLYFTLISPIPSTVYITSFIIQLYYHSIQSIGPFTLSTNYVINPPI